MRIVSESELVAVLSGVAVPPRVVVSGNFATPRRALAVLDGALAEYRLAGPVTSFQHSFIVSEQGVASIWGRDAGDQAQQIIDTVAHLDARDHLREAGRRLGFLLR